jgi:hypothetical protein
VSRGGATTLAFIAQRGPRPGFDRNNHATAAKSVPINRVEKLPCWGGVHMSAGLILQAWEVRGGGRKNLASRTPRQSRVSARRSSRCSIEEEADNWGPPNRDTARWE